MKKIFSIAAMLFCMASNAQAEFDNITSFLLAGQIDSTRIDSTGSVGRVDITMPCGVNVKMLTPVVKISGTSYRLLWNKNVEANADNTPRCPHYYEVLGASGNVKLWEVYFTFDNVSVEEPKSSECSIRSFKIGSYNGVIKNDTIRISNLPTSTDLSKLAPSILISDKATVRPSSGVAQDFTNPVAYTVTAEDATTQKQYTAIVARQTPTSVEKELDAQLRIYPNPAKSILRISLPQEVEKVEVYNMQGVLLKQTTNIEVNVSNFVEGNYIVKIYTAAKVILTRIITIHK